MDELRTLITSNARSIQALGEALETSRLQAEESRLQADEERRELREAMLRLTDFMHGLGNLTVSLDSDRPTILSKLDRIEGTVGRIERKIQQNSEG